MPNVSRYVTGTVQRIGQISQDTFAVEFWVNGVGMETFYINTRYFDNFATWLGYNPSDPNPMRRCTLSVAHNYIEGWQ